MNFVFTMHVKLIFTMLMLHYIRSSGISSGHRNLISLTVCLNFLDFNDFYFGFGFSFVVGFATAIFCSALRGHWSLGLKEAECLTVIASENLDLRELCFCCFCLSRLYGSCERCARPCGWRHRLSDRLFFASA